MDDSERLKALIGSIEPHRLTRRAAAHMAVREDPWSGELRVDPLVISALEERGYDPAPFVRQVLEDYRDG